MGLALAAAAVVAATLAWELVLPRLYTTVPARVRALARWLRPGGGAPVVHDQGRERRAEARARQLLRSCVNEEEWAMYRDLGLLRVWSRAAGADSRVAGVDLGRETRAAPCAYLVYPHRPIVAYAPRTGEVVGEYCVAFPDETLPHEAARLPDSDDVLAKWMALTGDERRLMARANMHLPGRQVDPRRVRDDLARLARWERERAAGTLRAA